MLNEQAHVLFEWRDKIVELLTQKLIDDSVQEENGPSPYERAAIVQAELESYMQAYQSLLVCGHSYLSIPFHIEIVAVVRSKGSPCCRTCYDQATREGASNEGI